MEFLSVREKAELIIQGLVEVGEFEYYTNKDGKLCIKKGINYGKEMPLPDIIAGQRIKWVK